MIISIPIVLVIRIIKPLIFVKLGYFSANRIGHLSIDTAIDLGEKKLTKRGDRSIDLYWLPRFVCNNQWEKMMRRSFKISSFFRPIEKCNRLLLKGGEIHIKHPKWINSSRDIDGVIYKTNPAPKFLTTEDQIAEKWLLNFGWEKGDKFVCLMIRDNAYLTSSYDFQMSEDAISYHSYRNSDINTYNKTVDWLLEQGYWVLRMGKVAKKKSIINHPRFIDYAFENAKNDLLDIWLFANCHLCISTLTGMDSISVSYNVPVIFVNALPLGHFISWGEVVHIPKNLQWIESGKKLTCEEHLEHNYFTTEEYLNNGISIVDLSENEILRYVKDGHSLIQKERVLTNNEWHKQYKFRNLLKKKINNYDKVHGWYHPKALISNAWLDSVGLE